MTNRFHVLRSLCVLIAAAALPLAAQSVNVKATIPFEFNVGGQTMPAGEYMVSNGIGTNVLSIGTTDGRATVNAFAVPLQTADGANPDTSRLLFRRYGDQYFLSVVWSSATPFGRELPKSRTERELSKSATVKPQSVFVLAQGPSARNTVAR